MPVVKPVNPPQSFQRVYDLPPFGRIDEIKRGVPATRVRQLAEQMHLPQSDILDLLGFARSSVNHKIGAQKALARDESELLLGVESLIGQVGVMVAQSGDPTGFDPARWIAGWIKTPNPALGGVPPADFMDTVEGQKLVSRTLAMAQTGAYA